MTSYSFGWLAYNFLGDLATWVQILGDFVSHWSWVILISRVTLIWTTVVTSHNFISVEAQWVSTFCSDWRLLFAVGVWILGIQILLFLQYTISTQLVGDFWHSVDQDTCSRSGWSHSTQLHSGDLNIGLDYCRLRPLRTGWQGLLQSKLFL